MKQFRPSTIRPLASIILLVVLTLSGGQGASAQQGWTAVYNDGCSGEGHRVLVGEITARAALGDGCDLVVGYVAPDQQYAGEWVWGYSPTGSAVEGAAPDDAGYFRPHICDVLPPFPWEPTPEWQTRVVEPGDFLYALYGPRYPAYIAASCRVREQDESYAQIGLDRALRPTSRLAEPPEDLVARYNEEVLSSERVALPVPAGRLTMVLPGDWLGLFAEVFDVPADEIQAANNMSDPGALLVGQMLLIPGAGEEPDPESSLSALCRLPVLRGWRLIRSLCTAEGLQILSQ